jgi:hypothetical protein
MIRIVTGALAVTFTAAGSIVSAEPARSDTNSGSVVPAGPARSDTNYGRIEHHSPDANYDPPILVRCRPDVYPGGGQIRKVREGDHSPCADADWLVLRSGEELWCFRSFSSEGDADNDHTNVWIKEADATGRHRITRKGQFGEYCTLRKD